MCKQPLNAINLKIEIDIDFFKLIKLVYPKLKTNYSNNITYCRITICSKAYTREKDLAF